MTVAGQAGHLAGVHARRLHGLLDKRQRSRKIVGPDFQGEITMLTGVEVERQRPDGFV